ncbi:MAG: hypothetical protein GXO62_04920 [Epsilonproteobacteria bacterium]|nr:hypothetical protein [Campylobacterota bacterium]
MKLEKHPNKLVIHGPIQTISHGEEIINALKESGNNIFIDVMDSYVIPSSVLSYLFKLIDDGKNVNLRVKHDQLFELLSDLNAKKHFNLQKL